MQTAWCHKHGLQAIKSVTRAARLPAGPPRGWFVTAALACGDHSRIAMSEKNRQEVGT